MRKRKSVFIIIFLVLALSVIYFFRISSSFHLPANYNYDSDLGRDLLSMYQIGQGKMTLIGPRLNFAGLHLSSYYYYLFAPFLALGNYDHRSVLFANAAFFVIGFALLYFWLSPKIGKSSAFLSILWLATSSYMILSGRSPGNAYSYLIFLAGYIIFLFFQKKVTKRSSFLYGLFGGVIANFHPLVIPVVVGLFLAKTRAKLQPAVFYLAGFLLSFLPVFIFDLRHNFTTVKLLFNPASYTEFLLFKRDSGLSNLFSAPAYYYFPAILFLQIFLVYLIGKTKKAGLILAVLVALNLFFWPKHLYQPARNLKDIESKFTQVITKDFLPAQAGLPDESLNVVLNNQTHLSKVGYEYRFILAKNKYKTLDEYSYALSKYLLLISERGPIDWEKEGGWEWAQFGDKKLLRTEKIDDFYYYLFEKVE